MTGTEIDNVMVFKDTLKQIEKNYPADIGNVRYYNGISPIEKLKDYPPVKMVQGGTVNTGYANTDKMRVAILNFADAIKYGGWVEYGAQTQEENICRCTNIYPILGHKLSDENYYKPNLATLNARPVGDYSHYGNEDEVYTDRIIYTRDVIVFKDDTTYENVEPRKLDVITCPAPSAQMSVFKMFDTFTQRAEQVLLSAIDNKAECIVLGAWGCGAFGQIPEVVARAFTVALNKYGGYFKSVVFAIKPTPHWGEKNLFTTFKTSLQRYYIGGCCE